MVLVYVSLGVVFCSAMALVGYARRRPFPAPAPAAVVLADPLADPWPTDEAAELIAAWRDQTGRCA